MKKTIVIVLSVFVSFSITSQERGNRRGKGGPGSFKMTISGQLIDGESGNPLEYGTIAIYNKQDSIVVGGGVSDVEGKFSIESRPGKLYATVDFISYESLLIDPVPFERGNRVVDLGQISLYPASHVIEGVEIRAQKSEVEYKLDKKVFNVGQDLVNKGGSAEEILDNVPSVTVDIEGTVSLRGSENVRILVDGRPSGLVGLGGTRGLKSIPANMIDKIEVITNPSARYEAEGMAGIINIVLRKDKKSGLNGSVDVSVGYPESYGAGPNLSYRTGRVNLFTNYGLRKRTSNGSGLQYQRIFADDYAAITDQVSERERKSLSNSVRFGMDYYFSDNDILTGSFLYRRSSDDNTSLTTYNDSIYEFPMTFLDGITIREETEVEKEPIQEYSLEYRKLFPTIKDKEFTARISFNDNSETESSDFEENVYSAPGVHSGIEPALQRSGNSEGQQRIQIESDFVLPLDSDTRFETGIRGSFRTIKNDFLVEELVDNQWENVDGFSNNFNYEENIMAAYAMYGTKMGKFSWQLGLRGEYSDVITELLQTNEINPRDYFDLFPSAHVNYEVNESAAFQVRYSRRVNRPIFWFLNPFFTYSDPRNFFAGNPNLDPVYSNSYEIGHLRYFESGNVGASIYYRHADDAIERLKIVDVDAGTSITRPYNLATEDSYGVELNFSYSSIKWYRLDGSANFFRRQKEGELFDQVFESDDFTWNSKVTQRFTFWNESDLQIRANYRAPSETTQGKRESIFMVDLGLSKPFLNRRLNMTISVRDLLNNRKRRYEVIGDNFYNKGQFQWRSRSVNVNFNYLLNNQDKSRRKQGNRSGQGEFEGGGEEF